MSFHAHILAHRAPHAPVNDPVLRAPGEDVPHAPGIGIPHSPSVGLLHAPGVDVLALLELVFLMLQG